MIYDQTVQNKYTGQQPDKIFFQRSMQKQQKTQNRNSAEYRSRNPYRPHIISEQYQRQFVK